MRPKIQEQPISIQSLLVKKSVVDMERCADLQVFVLHGLGALIIRMTDKDFSLNVSEK